MAQVSGCVMLVVPNVCGITIWSPPLDEIGNSVKGIKFAKELVRTFNFHHLDSAQSADKINPTMRFKNSNSASAIFDLLSASSAGNLGTVQVCCVPAPSRLAVLMIDVYRRSFEAAISSPPHSPTAARAYSYVHDR